MVRHLPCGEFVNASEKLAVERLCSKLEGKGGDWIILSNLNHAQYPNARSDEIDIVVIGENGVHVIEVKHWDLSFLRQQSTTVEQEAERVNDKAKRIAGKLRKNLLDPGFVSARMLLTRGELKFEAHKRPMPRGVPIFGLPEWADLLSVSSSPILSPEKIESAARILEPAVKVALSGEVRSFAGLINLERASDRSDAFHRVFRGQHPTRRDRVILHLYDLSAVQEKQALELARREFETIQRWQKSPYVPSLLDSFQEAEGYPGELYFYSIVDPAAPALKDRQVDREWDVPSRLLYARTSIGALAQFHHPNDESLIALLHRRITPESLRVRHNGQPLFTDFSLTRLQDARTICAANVDFGAQATFTAPEVRSGGLGAADTRSDVYALCASLSPVFDGEDALSAQIREILESGCRENPDDRSTLDEIARRLDGNEAARQMPDERLPAPEYWDEDTIVQFQQSRFKVVGRLGSGGIGQTFKVVELDGDSDEKFGTYVAKVVVHAEDGAAAVKAYRKVRAYTTHPNLSAIHEIAPEWKAGEFIALMKWVEGMPLQDLIGVLPIHAEDIGEPDTEALAMRWLAELCGGLGELHRVGLVHGDVSPNNIIVHGASVVLTDYDTVTNDGAIPRSGTSLYSSPAVQTHAAIHPSDDVYALAASVFRALTDRDPFGHGIERRKDKGLNWDSVTGFEILRSFLDKATSPHVEDRFGDAMSAQQYLLSLANASAAQAVPIEVQPSMTLTENHAPWLRSLLSAYPGSRHGNRETRGLDSDFAVATYVETKLDEVLYDEIQAGKVNLVILFGNAGDGKTAFLQRLAQRLGISNIRSSSRVWNLQLKNGKQLKVNLDGSAAWQGKSANQLLDDLFEPFHTPEYTRSRVHIVAINSGKLLEWVEEQQDETYLTQQLRQILIGQRVELDAGFRLIDLNQRSLVGGIDLGSKELTTTFLTTLLNRFLTGNDVDPWKPCVTCTAQNRCTAWHSVQSLRDTEGAALLRRRLTDVLQACHQRGEIHITARELRAALSYIFFGVDDCSDLHDDHDLRPARYWERAFDARSQNRQGELLAELARFDPALEAHPILDRAVLKQASKATGGRLAEGRRRAWFSYVSAPDEEMPVRLTNGRHFERFRQVPFMRAGEKRELLNDVCLGVAHLEVLPHTALSEEYVGRGVPLRIKPRTPTETALWVVKPWHRFAIEAPLPLAAEGLEALHTHVRLIYSYANGGEEILLLGLELFNLLLDLKDGVQLSGIGQDGVFANLEVFTQRLAREDSRELFGLHPAEADKVFRLHVESQDDRQLLLKEVV